MRNVWLDKDKVPTRDRQSESVTLPEDHAIRYARYLKGYVNGVYTMPAFKEGFNCTAANVVPLGNGKSQVDITWERNTR